MHETAIVDHGAHIGANTRIWHHAQVREGAEVGPDCVIGKNVYIDRDVRIGARVKIQNNVSVYAGVELEDEVFVGPSAVFTNDRYPRAINDEWEIVKTHVRRGASIGANSTIVCGIEIGRWGMVAAGSVVTRSIEPYELVAGNPARRIGWACRCGQILERGAGPLKTTECGHCGQRPLKDDP